MHTSNPPSGDSPVTCLLGLDDGVLHIIALACSSQSRTALRTTCRSLRQLVDAVETTLCLTPGRLALLSASQAVHTGNSWHTALSVATQSAPTIPTPMLQQDNARAVGANAFDTYLEEVAANLLQLALEDRRSLEPGQPPSAYLVDTYPALADVHVWLPLDPCIQQVQHQLQRLGMPSLPRLRCLHLHFYATETSGSVWAHYMQKERIELSTQIPHLADYMQQEGTEHLTHTPNQTSGLLYGYASLGFIQFLEQLLPGSLTDVHVHFAHAYMTDRPGCWAVLELVAAAVCHASRARAAANGTGEHHHLGGGVSSSSTGHTCAAARIPGVDHYVSQTGARSDNHTSRKGASCAAGVHRSALDSRCPHVHCHLGSGMQFTLATQAQLALLFAHTSAFDPHVLGMQLARPLYQSSFTSLSSQLALMGVLHVLSLEGSMAAMGGSGMSSFAEYDAAEVAKVLKQNLGRLQTLRTLILRRLEGQPRELLKVVAELPNLRELRLHDGITYKNADLVVLLCCPELTDLAVDHLSLSADPPKMMALRKLHVGFAIRSRCRLHEVFPAVTSFSISYMWEQALLQIAGWQSLTSLTLDKIEDGKDWGLLRTLTSLTSLHLGRGADYSQLTEVLHVAQGLPLLRKLTLQGWPYPRPDRSRIQWPGTDISTAMLAHFRSRSALPLELYAYMLSCPWEEQPALAMCMLRGMTALHTLHLRDCDHMLLRRLAADGAQLCMDTERGVSMCPSSPIPVQCLTIQDMDGLTVQDVEAAVEGLPALKRVEVDYDSQSNCSGSALTQSPGMQRALQAGLQVRMWGPGWRSTE